VNDAAPHSLKFVAPIDLKKKKSNLVGGAAVESGQEGEGAK
jgi:hypothetical protein